MEEAEGRLRLGYFTQDLAQDLPQDQIALDVVMDAARERFDPLLPDEEGRRVLGALGLRGVRRLLAAEPSGGALVRFFRLFFCLSLLVIPSFIHSFIQSFTRFSTKRKRTNERTSSRWRCGAWAT